MLDFLTINNNLNAKIINYIIIQSVFQYYLLLKYKFEKK